MSITESYRYYRNLARYPFPHGLPAALALAEARKDPTRRYYGSAAQANAEWNSGSNRMRIIENYAALGFRLVGFADEIAPRLIEHRGWYMDPFGDGETVRGAVFLIPGKNGKARAFAGFLDPYGNNAAFIAIDSMEEIDARSWELDNSDYRDSAARADDVAKHYAEREREYQTAWQAGVKHRDNMERIAEARKEARQVARAARDNVRDNTTICAVLREKVRDLRQEIRELSEENETLRNGDYSRRDYSLVFYPSDELRAAFNEGAEGEVI